VAFVIYGSKLFNMMPSIIRVFNDTIGNFNIIPNVCLGTVPDKPGTISYKPKATSLLGSPSNSLVDWVRKLLASSSSAWEMPRTSS
jgi:hypothetical protein